ncbi:MAG: substrate-binding domain-containing protein [Cyanobacteriota bacterium]|nr:substrate-binding domain-containing protein [Cyanobacteriota bacterium]
MVSAITRRRMLSLSLVTGALVLAGPGLPGLRQPLLVAVGSEMEPAMQRLEAVFERRHPGVDLRWQVQGAQDMVNRQLDAGAERARVLIPSNASQLEAFRAARQAQGDHTPFEVGPQPIARTLLVAVAWPDRARQLFADGRFSWPRLRQAAAAGQWSALGGPAAWGNFDLRSTDPLRSTSGQLTLALWSLGEDPQQAVPALRRAVYRPSRSTDILLREFISGGPNDGDLAMVYESGAIVRGAEVEQRRAGGLRMLVPDPTIEIVLAAAVVRGEAQGRASDGRRLVAYLAGPEGQSTLRQLGFRSPDGHGGSAAGSAVRRLPPPPPATLDDLLKRWQQSS